MRNKKPGWTKTRSVAVPPEFAARVDALASSASKTSRSGFLLEMIESGLIAKYGPRWEVIADALIADHATTEAA